MADTQNPEETQTENQESALAETTAVADQASADTAGEAPAEEKEDLLPPPRFQIEDAGAARKRIKIEVPGERIKGKLEEAFKELQHDAVMPGFRRGRAPMRLIEKRFGGDIRNSVKQQVVAEAYEKAIEESKLEAIGDPEIDLKKIELPAEGDLAVTVEVEVTPEFELPSIEKISVKKPILEANDERLNLAMENLRKYFGHWQDSHDPVSAEDTVTADVKITQEDATLVIEQPAVSFVVKTEDVANIAGMKFPELGEKLKGQTIGSTLALEGTLPEDYPEEKIRGAKVKVELTIKGVRHQQLPEVNAEFAEMLGFESIDELKKDLTERLVVQLEQETKGAIAQQVYRYLLSNTDLQLPAKLSQRQMGNVLRRRATELMQRGVPEAEIVQQIDRLRISSAQQAAVDLRLFFIMSKLADQFSVEVSGEEVNARIAAIAMQYGRRPEKLKSEMSASGQLEQVFLQIRDGKVVDKLVEMGEVTEVDEKVLAEEFKNLPPLTNVGPNVTGVSHSTPPRTEKKDCPPANRIFAPQPSASPPGCGFCCAGIASQIAFAWPIERQMRASLARPLNGWLPVSRKGFRMPLLLDDRHAPLPPFLTSDSTLGEILQWAGTQLSDSRVVVQVRLEDRVLEGDALSAARKEPLADGTLAVVSADRRELSLTTLGKLAALIEWLAPQHKQVAASMEKGDVQLGLQRLQEILTAWQRIQLTFGNLARMHGIVLSELRVREVTGEAVLEEFCGQLGEIQTALERRDFVLLADILQYEIDGAVANWMGLLQSALGVIDPAACAA